MAKTILVLAANPKDTSPLRLDEEIREIDNGLQRAKKRDDFILKPKLAVRPIDFRRAVLDYRPYIVHFCGHGSGEEGIALEDKSGHAKLVSTDALSGFFELFTAHLECVVLNACYSEVQAEAIANHIPYVVGMKREIGDAAAIEFATAFYDALGAGESFEFAFMLARNAIQWASLPEDLRPVLKAKEHVGTDGQRLTASPLDDAISHYLTTLRERIEERRISQRQNVQRNLLDLYVEPLGASEPPPVAAHASTSLSSPQDPQVLTFRIGGASPPVQAVTSPTTPRDLWSLISPHLESGKPCALIADFGTGKSWFLEMTLYRLAGDRLAGKGWVPLLMSLRNFHPAPPPSPGLATMLASLLGGVPKASSPFEQIREQAWAAAFGESLAPAQFKDLLRLYEEGRFLFLLDALDEMGSGARDEARALLSDVGRLATNMRRSPVLLTARRSFFRDAADEERLKDDGFEVFYLWPWSPEAQLRAYLDRAAAIKLLEVAPSDVLKNIEATYDLVDLAQRALLAAMLVDQWTDLASSRSIDLPTLYGRHVEKALLQWQGKKTRTLTMAQVRHLMVEIAFLMFRLDSLVLSAEEMDQYFDKVLARRGVEKYSEVAESLVRDIELNSLLVREKDGFAFCHLSLWEFLVAERLRSALIGAEDSLFSVLQRSRRYESIMKHFLVPMLMTDSQHNLLQRLFLAGPSHNSPHFRSTGQ
jgi:hypothetical protein